MKKLILVAILLAFLTNCKEKEIPVPGSSPKGEEKEIPLNPDSKTPSIKETNEFNPSNKGSFWIYDVIKVVDGIETNLDHKDSVVVTGDTIINGLSFTVFKTYHIYDNKPRNVSIIHNRDSSGFIISDFGFKYFSSSNFTDTLFKSKEFTKYNDPIYDKICKMEIDPVTVSLPVGTLTGLNSAVKYIPIIENYGYPVNNPAVNLKAIYVKNIGLVFKESKLEGSSKLQQQLIRYEIK